MLTGMLVVVAFFMVAYSLVVLCTRFYKLKMITQVVQKGKEKSRSILYRENEENMAVKDTRETLSGRKAICYLHIIERLMNKLDSEMFWHHDPDIVIISVGVLKACLYQFLRYHFRRYNRGENFILPIGGSGFPLATIPETDDEAMRSIMNLGSRGPFSVREVCGYEGRTRLSGGIMYGEVKMQIAPYVFEEDDVAWLEWKRRDIKKIPARIYWIAWGLNGYSLGCMDQYKIHSGMKCTESQGLYCLTLWSREGSGEPKLIRQVEDRVSLEEMMKRKQTLDIFGSFSYV